MSSHKENHSNIYNKSIESHNSKQRIRRASTKVPNIKRNVSITKKKTLTPSISSSQNKNTEKTREQLLAEWKNQKNQNKTKSSKQSIQASNININKRSTTKNTHIALLKMKIKNAKTIALRGTEKDLFEAKKQLSSLLKQDILLIYTRKQQLEKEKTINIQLLSSIDIQFQQILENNFHIFRLSEYWCLRSFISWQLGDLESSIMLLELAQYCKATPNHPIFETIQFIYRNLKTYADSLMSDINNSNFKCKCDILIIVIDRFLKLNNITSLTIQKLSEIRAELIYNAHKQYITEHTNNIINDDDLEDNFDFVSFSESSIEEDTLDDIDNNTFIHDNDNSSDDSNNINIIEPKIIEFNDINDEYKEDIHNDNVNNNQNINDYNHINNNDNDSINDEDDNIEIELSSTEEEEENENEEQENEFYDDETTETEESSSSSFLIELSESDDDENKDNNIEEINENNSNFKLELTDDTTSSPNKFNEIIHDSNNPKSPDVYLPNPINLPDNIISFGEEIKSPEFKEGNKDENIHKTTKFSTTPCRVNTPLMKKVRKKRSSAFMPSPSPFLRNSKPVRVDPIIHHQQMKEQAKTQDSIDALSLYRRESILFKASINDMVNDLFSDEELDEEEKDFPLNSFNTYNDNYNDNIIKPINIQQPNHIPTEFYEILEKDNKKTKTIKKTSPSSLHGSFVVMTPIETTPKERKQCDSSKKLTNVRRSARKNRNNVTTPTKSDHSKLLQYCNYSYESNKTIYSKEPILVLTKTLNEMDISNKKKTK